MSQHAVWVVFNVNGDVIGVADSPDNASSIYEKLYMEPPPDFDERIRRFELNQFVYA